MNTGEDESTSGLNGRLRPRKSNTTIPSPVGGRPSRKVETKPIHEKQKRNSTPSKTAPNDDLNKPQSSPDPQFLCPYCDRKFVSKLSASKHARRIHLFTSKQDNFIKCLYCNLSEAAPHDVIRHMVDSHPNQYFACLDCHTRFPSTTELAEHKLNVCEKQKAHYRSKLRQKQLHNSTKNKKKLNVDQKDKFSNENKEYANDKTFNGIVISCELKPSQIQDAADIEDNITTNLILPPGKTLANTNLEKNGVIVLDDMQWNKRTPNFTFHNTDTDQILSRLGVVHRSPRVGESTRRAWFKMLDENNPKFEKCFDTNFYSRVASNVQENLTRFLDGSFNFNPDADSTIKTRKSKSSVIINTAEGFPILLAYEQFSRHVLDGYMPRQLTPRHKWKWDSTENGDNAFFDPNAIKSDSHVNNCIITLVSSLDIWTQLRMRRKYEDVFSKTSSEKTEINNIIASELKEILESREIPASSSQIVKYTNTSEVPPENRPELPSYLGLSPVEPKCELQPAVLSGEWVRPRCYICCACGAQTRDSRGLTSHMSSQHPNAQVQHYEIVGEPLLNADISKHLYVPPNQTANRTRPPRGFRDCTKCKKSIALEDLHQHMLDCAGDTPAVRRKCRYRPFGVRRRRPRLPDNSIRKKIRKEIRSRHRQKAHMRPRPKIRTDVGDAETIRKMIADLPAKRVRVSLNSTLNVKTRKAIENKRNKLRIKRQNSDGIKNIVTRSKKIIAKGFDADKQSADSQSDDDDEPLKINIKTTAVKKSHEILPKASTASTKSFNKTDKININDAEVNVRQHSDRNKNSNDQQDGKDIGGGGNKDNDNENNVSHGWETPLKHSIARITSNDNIQLKSQEQNCDEKIETNNIEYKDGSGDTLRLFEDETKSDKVDKPPLQDCVKSLDPGGFQKSKLNKPRKRLNDCIAMLMQKTSQAQDHKSTSEADIGNSLSDRDSATASTANAEIHEQHSEKSYKEMNIGVSRGSTPIADGSVSQASNIVTGSINDTEQSLVSGRHSQILRTEATMFPQTVESDIMARLAREATHYETIRQQMFTHEALNATNVYERRRSHEFAPPRMTQNDTSKRRSSRLKSDSRDYQPRPQYPGFPPGYLNIMPASFPEYYDIPYANMRRPSFDGPTLLPINQPLYHPQFFPAAANTLNIPILSKPTENQNILQSDNKNKYRKMRMSDVVQNSQTHYTSPDSRRKRWSSTSSEMTSLSDYDSSQIYSQISPDSRGMDPHNRGQVNNNYIVSSNATPKLSPRHPPASLRSQREACMKSLNNFDTDIHVQRQKNTHNRSVENSPEFESGIDRVPGPYYPSRDMDSFSISPIRYETSKRAPEACYRREPSKCNDNTSFMEPSTSEIHKKAISNVENLDTGSEYLITEYERGSQQSHKPELSVGHFHTPLIETERVPFRESRTHHLVKNIINLDQLPQQHTKHIKTPEPIPSFETVPLDLRSQHKILSDITQRSQQKKLSDTSQDSQQTILSGISQSSQQMMLSDVSQSLQHNMSSDAFESSHQIILSDMSQKSQPCVYVRDISDLTGFAPASIQNVLTNESAGHKTENIQDDVPLDLNKISMYSQLSTSGLSGKPTMAVLDVAAPDNLNNNVISRPSIPTITLSPPDNVSKIKTGSHVSSQIKQNSEQETEQMQCYDKIRPSTAVEGQVNVNLSLKSQTPPSDPMNTINLTHKKTQPTDKRQLVPKEIIAVIEDLPQEQRDKLLDILPQFVRMSDSEIEANDEVANKTDQTNKDLSSSFSSSESPNNTENTSVSSLTINTNLMPAPSCVIPKKRHSPNVVTYTSQLNVSRTEVMSSTNLIVTPVQPSTVQDVTAVVTNSGLMRNTEQLTNTDNHLIDPYTGMMKSTTDLRSRENNEKDKDSITPIIEVNLTSRVETSLTSEPIKTPTRSKNSSEKTSILRMVRFNSSRKSLSDDKQLLYVKNKSYEQKEANEISQHEKDNSNLIYTLNDPSAPVIQEIYKETDIEKQNVTKKNAEVYSHHSNFVTDHFLDKETPLTKGEHNDNVALKDNRSLDSTPEADLTNPSAFEKVETNKLHDVGSHTCDKVNIPVNDSVYTESNRLINGKTCNFSMEKPLTSEKKECSNPNTANNVMIDMQDTEKLTEVLKDTKHVFDSDDEDISLADIAKLRRPKQTVASPSKSSSVTKRKRVKSIKNYKIIKKGKKTSENNVENISALSSSNKSTNKNRRANILANASCDYEAKEILSNDNIKQQDCFIKSIDQMDKVTETNPKHLQELHICKKVDGIDNVKKSIHLDKLENVNQSAYTEENMNDGNNRKIDLTYKSSKQEKEAQVTQNETIDDTILSNTGIHPNKIVSSKPNENCEGINKNTSKQSTISGPINFDKAQTNNISENLIQKSGTNISEKDNTVVTQKPLLTKKQLIFSKMLVDDETVTLTQEKHSTITNDGSIPKTVPSSSDNVLEKPKPGKRRKSILPKRKNKKQMKLLNCPNNESDSSESVVDTESVEGKQNHKKDLNNCSQVFTCTKENLDCSVDGTILVDKQNPTPEKRKSEMDDIFKEAKKTKLIDTKNVEDGHHQNSHQDIVTDNISENTEPVAIDTTGENMLKIKHKDSTNHDNKKRLDISTVSETRTTCYNRQIDFKPNRPISSANKSDNYDPYDIDLDETIAITEPAVRKTKHASRKSSHTAKPKSPTPFMPSHMSSSDSESSKSDVPLQKYVEEKRMLEQQLKEDLIRRLEEKLDSQQSKSEDEHQETPNRSVDTTVSESAATASNVEILFFVEMYGAEKARSMAIPEEAVNISSSRETPINTENNNEQQIDHQSTSAETQNEMSDFNMIKVENTDGTGNIDVPNVIESNKNKNCQESIEKKEFLESIEIKQTKENEESKECKENTIEIEIDGNVDIKQNIERKEFEESKDIEEIKVCSEVKYSETIKETTKNEEIKESTEKDFKVSKEKKQRRSNNTQSVETVDSIKTSEQTNTDKYMENFGFFSERKPRKSNLLAMKKITETMHMINEGDDAYFRSKDRSTKKSHRETRKSTEGETSMKNTQGSTKLNVDTVEQPKINDDKIKKIEKVSDEDGIMHVDINLNTAGTYNKYFQDLENKRTTKVKEESVVDSSKLNNNEVSVHIKESSSLNETMTNFQSSIANNNIDKTNVETKKTNKNKVAKIRPPGYKEKMYPDIEEIDLFEDKFDKIKRKSRTQAAAAKQTNVLDTHPSTSRKKTERKKKTYAKKSYHSSVVPTKGALKGFDGIKISISTQDLNMPSNVSPPRQKKRKRSNSKKKRERKDSASSGKYDSDTNLRETKVQEKDIYEFKDNDDTELLELRPSTVMDRFRSLNKEKSKLKEKDKDKEPYKNSKAKQVDDSDEDDGINKLKQFAYVTTRDYEIKLTKTDHDIKVNKYYRQIDGDSYYDNENMESPSYNKDVKYGNNFCLNEDVLRNIPNDDETDKIEDDDFDDDDDNVCLVSRSRFVPPTNDDSSFEWNGSPESGFVHMSGIDCICSPKSELENDTDRICDSSNCIYRKINSEKNAVMEKIFKNNALRRDANDINSDISPKANMDLLFDSLLETNSNDVSSEQNHSSKREISPIPGRSSNEYKNYSKDISLPISPREPLKSQSSHNTSISKKNKKSRSRKAEDAFSRLLSLEDTSTTSPPYVTPPRIDEDSVSNNEDLYRQCILSHNEDACSSDSTDHSNKMGHVDKYVMMSSKNTQTEDPETIVEDCTTKIKSCSDDDESDLETESNDIIVLRRSVSTKSHSAQTDDILETEYYGEYEECAPRPGDYVMVSTKSTQTRKHKSKSKHSYNSESDEELFNALEKTKITLKKFVNTATDSTQTEHKTKSRKALKHRNSNSSLKLSEPSTSKEKKKKKVNKTDMKVRDDPDFESPAKNDDNSDTPINTDQYEPAMEKPARKLERRISEDLDSFKYDTGVARQRARRKCTVGKQNVLAEHWSSESEVEASGQRASSANSVVASGSRRKKIRKREGKRSSSSRRSRGRDDEERGAPHGPSIHAPRPWASDNEEQITTVKTQQGWIVGGNHKKLVTLLANAKRRKKHNNDKRNTDE